MPKAPKSPEAVKLARRRMRALTPERRREIARKAARARWAKAGRK
ncbi:MAG TPA: hypothetical protein VNL18_15515 [Gemmatimonadales bacterium]|nr:hypothetical protein [Gemmatimonadales bacterium]